jgi:hypothetical protein
MFRIPWQPVPDVQYIQQLRRTLDVWDRYRPLLLALYVAMLGLFAWAVTRGVQFLVALARPSDAPWPIFGFVAGALLGIVVGWLFHFVIFSLSRGLLGFRAERLLVSYHDALAGTNGGSAADGRN